MRAIKRQIVLCIKNKGYEASLERRKLYEALPDPAAAKEKMVRVVDESGSDYVYPASFFAQLDLPTTVRRAVLAAV